MPAAIILLVFLFGLAEIFDWLQKLRLPLPIFLAGGLVMAVASNYDKRWVFPVWPAVRRQALGVRGDAADPAANPAGPRADRPEAMDLELILQQTMLQQGLGKPLTLEIKTGDSPSDSWGRSPKLPFED
jgi:hypothetical protein